VGAHWLPQVEQRRFESLPLRLLRFDVQIHAEHALRPNPQTHDLAEDVGLESQRWPRIRGQRRFVVRHRRAPFVSATDSPGGDELLT
jgi:hypothetical protein